MSIKNSQIGEKHLDKHHYGAYNVFVPKMGPTIFDKRKNKHTCRCLQVCLSRNLHQNIAAGLSSWRRTFLRSTLLCPPVAYPFLAWAVPVCMPVSMNLHAENHLRVSMACRFTLLYRFSDCPHALRFLLERVAKRVPRPLLRMASSPFCLS